MVQVRVEYPSTLPIKEAIVDAVTISMLRVIVLFGLGYPSLILSDEEMEKNV